MRCNAGLSIGELADATGVAVTVIRYYDEIGLVTPIGRVGGKRRFDPGDVIRLRFVRRAKRAGFRLDDIKVLLDEGNSDWIDTLDRHVAELRRQRDHLDEIISTLEHARRCGCDVLAHCPNIAPC